MPSETIQSFKKNIKFVELQAFEVDIMDIIPKGAYDKIKAKDPHPFFKAYSIAHEGVSHPKILGEDSEPIWWGKKAIQSIKKAVKSGIKFFKGHNEDSSTEGRRSLGEIIASSEKMIQGELNSIVVGYFPQETRDEVKQYNICSMEAVWNVIRKSGKLFGDTMEKLTGIALGSSDNDSPAWSGAKELASVQAFENRERIGNMAEENKLTFGQVATWCKDHNVFPSQLFTIDDIKKDREFNVIIENETKLNELIKTNKELETKNSEIQTKLDEAVVATQKSTAESRLEQMGKEQNWTENQKKYILSKTKEITNYDDDGLNAFVEKKTKDYKDAAAFFGASTDIPDADPGQEKTGDPNDYTKAENNELLDVDYED